MSDCFCKSLSRPACSCSSWVGYLGATGSYLTVWAFLGLQTINTLGQDFVAKTEPGYVSQMTTWHNLLAIWLWRYLISAVESVSIPGIVSVLGLILHYIPSYFLWVTGFMIAMLATNKSEAKMVSG